MGKTSNLNPKVIRRLYWKEKKSLTETGNFYGVNSGTLHRWMRKHRIPTRNKKEAVALRRKLKLTPLELERLYWKKKLSTKEIGKIFGVTGAAVLWHMRRHNIPRRTRSEVISLSKLVKRPSSRKLYRLYWIEGKSTIQIAKELKVSHGSVRKWLIKYQIPRRSRAKACRKYPRKSFSGDLSEKAYLIGFSIGDLYVCKHCQTIQVETTTTHPAMIRLFHKLFAKYGHCSKYPGKGRLSYQWHLSCGLDKSFEFLVKEKQQEPDCKLLYPFLAGYSDAEGCWMIGKSHSDGIGFAFEIQSQDRKVLEQIRIRLEERKYHPTFGPKLRKGIQKWGQLPLNKDLYYLRLLRRKEVFSIIERLLPYSKHQEKIDKMKLILRVKNETSWINVRGKVEALRKKIKDEVRKYCREAEKEYKQRRVNK